MMCEKLIACTCLFILLLAVQLRSQSSTRCQAKIEDFANAKPILRLPAGEAAEIVHALLPDVSRYYKRVGGNADNLQPDRLPALLWFTAIPGGRAGERLMVVRLVDDSCGAHFNCVAYVISFTPAGGARSALVGRDPSFGEGAGGASDVGVLQKSGSSYPDLLFLAHISAFETAVSCFTWQVNRYMHGPCTPECAHFLDQPQPK
jgi:hypothetical protein